MSHRTKAWLAFFWMVVAPTFPSLSSGSAEYPSDAYVRPTVDSLPVFETLCGVVPALGDPVERAAKFAVHRFELVERKGGPVTEWEFRFDQQPCPPTVIHVEERLNQLPDKILLTVSNDGDIPIEVACIVSEVGWWTDPARKPLNAVAVGSPVIPAGQTQAVTFAYGPGSGISKLRQPVTLAFIVREPKAGRTYRMAFSNLRVEYGSDPRQATLGGSGPFRGGQEAVFSVQAKGVVPGEQLDLQVEDGRWVLWRIRLSEQEIANLAEKGQAKIRRTVPAYLPSRKVTVTMVSRAGRWQAPPLQIEISKAPKPGFPKMKCEVVQGVPTILKDGKPMPWSGYATFEFQPGNVNQFGAHGANLFSLVTNAGRHVHNVTWPTWQNDGTFDFRQLDEYATMALAANPEANLLLRVSLSLPPRWLAKHPDARVVVRKNGKDFLWEETGGNAASFTSTVWREQQAKNLRTLIDYVANQPWAGRVAGILLMSGVTEEWFAWGANNTQCGDYSPVQAQAFVRWCETKGFPWKEIPSPEERMIEGTDFYPDTDAGRRVAAYHQFISDSTVDTISYFARVSKQSAPQLLAGVFYGYTVQLAGEPRQSLSGHFALRQLLDDPQIDFVAGVPLHNYRNKPNSLEAAFVSQSSCTASIRLAGKVPLNENDLFSWLHQGHWHTLHDPKDPRAGAISMNRRILADDVVNGISRYWYSLLSTWHDDEALQSEFREMHRIQAESLGWDRTPRPEIAFLVDDTSFAWLTPQSKAFRLSNADFLYALAKSGAPVGVYLLSDVAKLPDSAKLVVVANAVASDPQDLTKLADAIGKGGRKFLAVGPVGLIDPQAQRWRSEAPAQWLGLPLEVHSATRKGTLRAKSTGSILVEAGSVNPYATAKEEGWCDFVSENVADQPPGGAERPLAGEGTLTWSALPLTNQSAVRALVLSSGVRCYAPLGYVVNAAQGVVSVTAPQEGSVELTFPENAKWTDVFDRSVYEGGTFSCPFSKGQTRLFVRDGAGGR